MNKQEKIKSFNPNEPALNSNLFGLPFNEDECDIHVLPAAWEVTVSYGAGTMEGPTEVAIASAQVDLYDEGYPKGWERGIWMLDIDQEWLVKGEDLRLLATRYLQAYELGEIGPKELKIQKNINEQCGLFHFWIQKQTAVILRKGKRAILLGGDHSTSLGTIRAHKEHYGDFGVLQIDAHADLRPSYEGFEYSHASIMYNVLQEHLATSLTIVGLRDYCHQEADLIASDNRINAFTDRGMNKALFAGQTWTQVCRSVVNTLPDHVYLSVDIDGFDPSLCPSTGTPVPGGLSIAQFTYLLDAVIASGRKIIGGDLVEVVPGKDQWDANVGARVLSAISHRLA